MASDLVERLREVASITTGLLYSRRTLLKDAAAELEAADKAEAMMREEIASLRIKLGAKETEALGYLRAVGTLQDRIAETRAAALEEAAKLATICIDPADRCKCSTAYEIAAAIRALIPEQKEG